MRILAGVATGLFVAACTGGGGGDSTGAVVASDSVDSFIGSVCDLDAPCCSKVSKTYDGSACRSQLAQLAAGKAYDATKGRACLNEIQAAGDGYCTTGSQTPTCLAVFGSENATTSASGGAKAGEDCVGTTDKLGISLSPPGPTCFETDGIFCDTTTKKCTAKRGLGGACETFSSIECTDDLRCQFSEQKCVAPASAGQPCSLTATTWAMTCGTNLNCQNDVCTAVNGPASDVSEVACK